MESNPILGEPIGVVHVTINGQKVPANVYADRTCVMPDGTIRKVKQEVVDALLAKKRAAEAPAQAPVQQPAASQPHITRVQSQPVIQPAVQPTVQAPAKPAQPTQKKKNNKVIAAILAIVIVGGVAGYAFVPSIYDGMNGVLTAVTGHQVGVPPVSENSNSDDVVTPQPTVNQPASGNTDTATKALGDIDMSGDVTIEFYASVKTADGREYNVPLSTANLTDGTLTALLDSGGYPLTQNAQ